MRLQIQISGKQVIVELKRAGEAFLLKVHRNPGMVEKRFRLLEQAPGHYLLEWNGQLQEVFTKRTEGGRVVWVNNRRYEVSCRDTREVGPESASQPASAEGELRATMPARVVAVLVKKGETIQQGQPLLVLEAMKMQNELRAPVSGVVKELSVSTGDTVQTGQQLVVIERCSASKQR